MTIRTLIAVFTVTLSTAAVAQIISVDDLTGVWDYQSYAEIETPDQRMPVGAQMDFRADGTLLMTMRTATVEATYMIDGDTIVYNDANGEQVWTVQSYEPGGTLVVEYQRALMFFEKSGDD